MEDEIILRAEQISMLFPGTLALDRVDYRVWRGKVNVIIGENGAGKSTLMKILAGVQQPTAGSLFLNGEPLTLSSTRDAARHGLEGVLDVGDLGVVGRRGGCSRRGLRDQQHADGQRGDDGDVPLHWCPLPLRVRRRLPGVPLGWRGADSEGSVSGAEEGIAPARVCGSSGFLTDLLLSITVSLIREGLAILESED